MADPLTRNEIQVLSHDGRQGRLVRAFGIPLAGAMAIAGQALLGMKSAPLSRGIVPGAALYALAAALLLFALTRSRATGTAEERDPETETSFGTRPLRPALEWGLVAAVVLGGLFLRLYRIDLIPWGLNNDEAINAIEATEIAAGKPFSTVTERGLNRETMFHYLAAFSFRHPGAGLNLLRAMPAVFGLQPLMVDDEMMDRIFPLRLVSIVTGTLTILALYLFARERYGWRVGLLAAVFLAVSPWHLLYSRVGERVILAPLFGIATVAFVLRARDSGRTADHFAWGAALGLGLWTYTSFRAIPLALVAFVILARILYRSGTAAPGRAGILAGGLATVLLILMATLSHLTPKDFLLRGAYAILPPRANWGLNLLHAASLINFFPSRYAVIQDDAFISDGISTTYGLSGREPETLIVAALASLGILYAGWRAFGPRRDPASALMLLCVAALILTVGITGPSLTRMLLNLPWLCLFAALFAWRLFDDLAAVRRPLTAWIAGAAILGMAGLACAQGCGQYFLRVGRSERAMQHFGLTQTIMGMWVRSQPPPGSAVYVLHTLRVDTLKYLIGDRPDVHLITDPSTVDIDAIARLPRTVVFVLEFARPFAEPFRYLVNRFGAQGDASQVADANFYLRTGHERKRDDPDKLLFYTFTLWKDASGQSIPPPGSPPFGSPPEGTPTAAPPPPG